MTPTRLAALILVLVGALVLAYPVITYTTREKVIDLGPLEVTTEETHTVPLRPVLGALAIAAGVFVFFAGKKRNG